MSSRLIFFPVDERFCTRDYFILMAKAAGLEVLTPPKELLGKKKITPDIDRLLSWAETTARPGDTMIASVDMLVHGGLIPSRMSLESLATLERRLAVFERLKARGLRIYASVCVTRTPAYDSAEEEPDYWQDFGSRIFALSRTMARFRRGQAKAAEMKAEIDELPRWIVEDFLARRRRNFLLVSDCVDYVARGTFDYLNLVMDDNSEGSLSLWEAEAHGRKVDSLGLRDRVAIHSGADESTLTLLAKYLCDETRSRPRFKIEYTTPGHEDFIPAYEGLPLREGVRTHVEAAGGSVVESGEDVLLLVHNPLDRRESASQGLRPLPRAEREAIGRAAERLSSYPGVAAVAGIKFSNGSDNRLVSALVGAGMDWTRRCYAGWNTAGNTIGSVCALAVVQWLASNGGLAADAEAIKRLQAIFFIEHWGFQSNVRNRLLAGARLKGRKPWSLVPIEGWAIEFTEKALRPYAEAARAATGYPRRGVRVYFPWHRSFELGVELLD